MTTHFAQVYFVNAHYDLEEICKWLSHNNNSLKSMDANRWEFELNPKMPTEFEKQVLRDSFSRLGIFLEWESKGAGE